MEVLDKYTVRVHQNDLGKAMTFDAMTAAFSRFVLVSPKSYDMNIEQVRRHPVMSGPNERLRASKPWNRSSVC